MNERNQSYDLHTLSHTKWNCKYHVVNYILILTEENLLQIGK